MAKHHQLNLSPAEVRNSEHDDMLFRNSEHDSHALASAILDAALDASGITSKEAAHLLAVSVSLVDKWRSTEARGCPSFVQLLMLPPRFHYELHRAMNRRFGWSRQALIEAADSIGRALAMGER